MRARVHGEALATGEADRALEAAAADDASLEPRVPGPPCAAYVEARAAASARIAAAV